LQDLVVGQCGHLVGQALLAAGQLGGILCHVAPCGELFGRHRLAGRGREGRVVCCFLLKAFRQFAKLLGRAGGVAGGFGQVSGLKAQCGRLACGRGLHVQGIGLRRQVADPGGQLGSLEGHGSLFLLQAGKGVLVELATQLLPPLHQVLNLLTQFALLAGKLGHALGPLREVLNCRRPGGRLAELPGHGFCALGSGLGGLSSGRHVGAGHGLFGLSHGGNGIVLLNGLPCLGTEGPGRLCDLLRLRAELFLFGCQFGQALPCDGRIVGGRGRQALFGFALGLFPVHCGACGGSLVSHPSLGLCQFLGPGGQLSHGLLVLQTGGGLCQRVFGLLLVLKRPGQGVVAQLFSGRGHDGLALGRELIGACALRQFLLGLSQALSLLFERRQLTCGLRVRGQGLLLLLKLPGTAGQVFEPLHVAAGAGLDGFRGLAHVVAQVVNQFLLGLAPVLIAHGGVGRRVLDGHTGLGEFFLAAGHAVQLRHLSHGLLKCAELIEQTGYPLDGRVDALVGFLCQRAALLLVVGERDLCGRVARAGYVLVRDGGQPRFHRGKGCLDNLLLHVAYGGVGRLQMFGHLGYGLPHGLTGRAAGLRQLGNDFLRGSLSGLELLQRFLQAAAYPLLERGEQLLGVIGRQGVHHNGVGVGEGLVRTVQIGGEDIPRAQAEPDALCPPQLLRGQFQRGLAGGGQGVAVLNRHQGQLKGRQFLAVFLQQQGHVGQPQIILDRVDDGQAVARLQACLTGPGVRFRRV